MGDHSWGNSGDRQFGPSSRWPALLVVGAMVMGGVVALQWRSADEGVGPDHDLAVPLVGIDLPGWELERTDPAVHDPSGESVFDASSAVFSRSADRLAPFIRLSVTSADADVGCCSDDVDLGHGAAGQFLGDHAISWQQDDGSFPVLTEVGVTRPALISYASRLAEHHVDLATASAPVGMSHVVRGRGWGSRSVLRRAEYTTPNGALTIEVTNQPVWLEALIDASYTLALDETVVVGANPLGSGHAELSEVGAQRAQVAPGAHGPVQEAFWRTPDGLDLHLRAYGLEADGIVRQILEEGRLVILPQ